MSNQGEKRRQHSTSAGNSFQLLGVADESPRDSQQEDELAGTPERAAPEGANTASPGSGQQDRARVRVGDRGALHLQKHVTAHAA